MRIVAAVRFVAGGAAQVGGRLVHVLLLEILGPLGVAGQARGHGAGLQEARRLPAVRIVADRAIVLRSRVLHLGGGNLLGLLLVADHAGGLHVLLRQHHLAVLGRLMAVVALLVFKRVVQERLHQLRRIGLACIVALNAIGRLERLAMVRLDDRRILHVVAVNAQRRSVFGQVIGEFALLRDRRSCE